MTRRRKTARRAPKSKPDQSKVVDAGLHARRQAFLTQLAKVGFVQQAAELSGITRQTHYDWLEKDDSGEYAAGVEDAQKQYIEKLEREADRRAVEGCLRMNKYETYREYSDTLLMFRLKRLDPRYREHVEVSAGVKHSFDREALRIAAATPEGREAVRKLTELIVLAGAKEV